MIWIIVFLYICTGLFAGLAMVACQAGAYGTHYTAKDNVVTVLGMMLLWPFVGAMLIILVLIELIKVWWEK